MEYVLENLDVSEDIFANKRLGQQLNSDVYRTLKIVEYMYDMQINALHMNCLSLMFRPLACIWKHST